MMSMFVDGAVAIAQVPGPQPARTPRLEEQWKAKLNANTVSIIAGSPEETYLDITHDLAVLLNDDNLRILPIAGMGGAQNIRDVLYLKGVDIGITSTQMLRYFASTGELTTALDQRLNYIARMFPEEMHVVAGRGVKTIEELTGKKVNFSDSGSSTQITARDVFGLLGIAVNEVNLSQADAITAIKNGEIAATVVFSGKPAGIFSHVSANDNLHLLEIPITRTLENVYSPAQLEQTLYPNLIDNGQTIQTIAVDAVLITNNWQPASDRYRRVAKFVEALFSRFAEFRSRRDIRNGRKLTSARNCRDGSAFRRRRSCCSKPSSTNSGRNSTAAALRLSQPQRSSDCSGSSANGRKVRANGSDRLVAAATGDFRHALCKSKHRANGRRQLPFVADCIGQAMVLR